MTEAETKRHWKVLSSKISYQDRWLTLRTDRCETSRGKILEGFHVVELPDWINVIGVDDHANAILVREYRHGAGRFVTGLPSGILEKVDGSPLTGARREMQEETGYAGGTFFEIGSAFPNPAIQSNRAHSFLAVGLKPGHATHFDPGEDIDLEVVPFGDFFERALTGRMDLQSIHIAACHLALGFILKSEDPALADLKRISSKVLQGL